MVAESLLARRTGIEPGAASEARGDAHRRRCDDKDETDGGSGSAPERREESGAEAERAGAPCWWRPVSEGEEDEEDKAGDDADFEFDLAGAEMRRIVIEANSCHLRCREATQKMLQIHKEIYKTMNMPHNFHALRTASRHRHSQFRACHWSRRTCESHPGRIYRHPSAPRCAHRSARVARSSRARTRVAAPTGSHPPSVEAQATTREASATGPFGPRLAAIKTQLSHTEQKMNEKTKL